MRPPLMPLRAIQVDGGSEVMAGGKGACREPGVPFVVLPPHIPKAQRARRPR